MTSRQRKIIDLWEGFEKTEPDISTERLMEQVCQAAHTDTDEVCESIETEAKERIA